MFFKRWRKQKDAETEAPAEGAAEEPQATPGEEADGEAATAAEPETPAPDIEPPPTPEAPAPAETKSPLPGPEAQAPAEPMAETEAEVEPEPPVAPEPETPAKAEPAAETQIDEEAEAAPETSSFFQRVFRGLGKTRQNFSRRLRRACRLKARLDDDLLEEIEEILIQADLGLDATVKIIEEVRLEGQTGDPPERVMELLKTAIGKVLRKNERTFAVDPTVQPYVVLVVGVNGTGKTTTIGKIAQKLHAEGKRVMLVAGDTFRAAAIEQLGIWANRTGAEFVSSEMGRDPASVCYGALEQARDTGVDVVLIDTAGRLHTKKHLMAELEKVVRVIDKVQPDAPHETLLVLDATTGQNAINQAKIFTDICGVTGIVMTKLDGTAKGGVLIALRDQFETPVLMIGVGESADDLRPFDADVFVDALFAEEEETTDGGNN